MVTGGSGKMEATAARGGSGARRPPTRRARDPRAAGKDFIHCKSSSNKRCSGPPASNASFTGAEASRMRLRAQTPRPGAGPRRRGGRGPTRGRTPSPTSPRRASRTSSRGAAWR
eukprot:5931907-Lingulodinium_polyedra.AAC.1